MYWTVIVVHFIDILVNSKTRQFTHNDKSRKRSFATFQNSAAITTEISWRLPFFLTIICSITCSLWICIARFCRYFIYTYLSRHCFHRLRFMAHEYPLKWALVISTSLHAGKKGKFIWVKWFSRQPHYAVQPTVNKETWCYSTASETADPSPGKFWLAFTSMWITTLQCKLDSDPIENQGNWF